MKTEKIYYKVVRVIDGRYYSANHSLNYSWYDRMITLRLEYKLNEPVTAKIGKIFIFDCLESARLFQHKDLGGVPTVVLKVKAIGRVAKILSVVDTFYLDAPNQYFTNYWKKSRWKLSSIVEGYEAPMGTLGAKTVIPIEII